MDVRQALLKHLVDIGRQEDSIIAQAQKMSISPHDMRYSDGTWVLVPILVAKAQTLNGLAMLERKT